MKYIPNPSFDTDYYGSDEALNFVGSLAAAAVPISKGLAPKRLGNLADSIESEAGIVDGVATGRLNAFDFKAHWKENGTATQAPEPFLRPAVETVTGVPVT